MDRRDSSRIITALTRVTIVQSKPGVRCSSFSQTSLAQDTVQESRARITGHFWFAALIKARERQVPWWALVLATGWLDVVFVSLYVAGIESIEALSGTHGGHGVGIIRADYTH
jgi:hypothetical protein